MNKEMRFSGTLIPAALFDLARNKMLSVATFTPDDVRQHLLSNASAEMFATNSIQSNHRIIAERVMRAVLEDLVAEGKVAQLKRGVWTRK